MNESSPAENCYQATYKIKLTNINKMREVEGKQSKQNKNLVNCEGEVHLTLEARLEAWRNIVCDFVAQKGQRNSIDQNRTET